MDLSGGLPYWFLEHGLGAVYPPLGEDAECDVLIIGSGITGALLAYELAGAGRSVVVLDGRDAAQGSTMSSTALLQYDLDAPLHKLQGVLGVDRASRAYLMGVEAIDLLERIGGEVGVPVWRGPSLYIARDEGRVASLELEYAARAAAALEVDWVDGRELADTWGLSARAGILSHRAGSLDPYAFTHALLAAAGARGARVFDRTRVASMRVVDDGVEAVTERGPAVRAAWVVHATGYEAAAKLPPRAVDLASTYAVVSEPVGERESTPRECTWWEYDDPYLYGRWANGRLMVGGEDVPFHDARRRDQLLRRKAETLVRKAGEVMPGVRFEPAFAWTGTFGSTPDGLGYIGALPGSPREFIALGFGGNGITFSALSTGIIRSAIEGAEHPDAHLFAVDRERSDVPV